MKLDFAGRRALVTGGNKGIGRAIAELLAQYGAEVVVTGTDEAALSEAGKTKGIRAERVDLSAADGQEYAVAVLGGVFDVLVNNAGINKHGLTSELDMADFDSIMAINLRAVAALCRACLPHMIAKRYGRIVNIASIFSVVSKSRRASYTASKFALVGFTRAIALDHASQGVLANCVSPGFIGTEMTQRMLGPDGIREMVTQVPLGRLGEPAEVAKAVAFLASSDNSFITGQNVIIDGGFTST